MISTAVFAGIATMANAATPAHFYTNAVTTHNVATMQQTIIKNAFQSFTGFMSTNTHKRPQKYAPMPQEDPKTTYGRAAVYGTSPLYGEFNDDGTYGRSGGDTINTDAALNNLWANWNTSKDAVKFDEFDRADSRTNMYTFGIAGGQSEFVGGLSKWGLYTGYIDATQSNHDFDIQETGGFFGIYNGNKFGKFGLYVTLNGGTLNNSADTEFGTDEYTNMWAGAAVNATYDFAMDPTFTIQPNFQVGYIFVDSDSLTSASGDTIHNEATGILQVTPMLRAIKHIGSGWYGSANVQHVMFFENGGDTVVNNTTLDALNIANYTEYGISLERNILNMNLSATFGRRDGARDGWIGGVNVKYVF